MIDKDSLAGVPHVQGRIVIAEDKQHLAAIGQGESR
jgi:hypothetical protein